MSATTSMFEEQAATFAAHVRTQLSDLPADEIDDLLDGLEADLTERLTDGGELGDAELYAAELRQAAGLPPRGAIKTEKPHRSFTAAIAETARDAGARFAAYFDATPARQAIRDFVISLRPVWWVARGLTVAGVLIVFLGITTGGSRSLRWPVILLALACVVLSVQWGRGKWAPNRWVVGLRRLGNAFAVVAFLPVLFATWSVINTPVYASEPSPIGWGLNIDGTPITNIYAYDCAGNPIDVVRLYDQDGIEITYSRMPGADVGSGWDERTQENVEYAPNSAVIGDGHWNAYPLNEYRWSAMSGGPQVSPITGEIETAEHAEAATWPFTERGPLNTECAVDQAAAAESGESLTDSDGGSAASDESDATADDVKAPEGDTAE